MEKAILTFIVAVFVAIIFEVIDFIIKKSKK